MADKRIMKARDIRVGDLLAIEYKKKLCMAVVSKTSECITDQKINFTAINPDKDFYFNFPVDIDIDLNDTIIYHE